MENQKEAPQVERLAVSIAEAAKMCGIGRTLAYQLALRGELPVRRIGGRMIVPIAALKEWLAAQD